LIFLNKCALVNLFLLRIRAVHTRFLRSRFLNISDFYIILFLLVWLLGLIIRIARGRRERFSRSDFTFLRRNRSRILHLIKSVFVIWDLTPHLVYFPRYFLLRTIGGWFWGFVYLEGWGKFAPRLWGLIFWLFIDKLLKILHSVALAALLWADRCWSCLLRLHRRYFGQRLTGLILFRTALGFVRLDVPGVLANWWLSLSNEIWKSLFKFRVFKKSCASWWLDFCRYITNRSLVNIA